MEQVYALFMKELWSRSNAKEARLQLIHFPVVEKEKTVQRVDMEIKNSLKVEKFRWKTLISNAHGSRILEMGVVNPNPPSENQEVKVAMVRSSVLVIEGTSESTEASSEEVIESQSYGVSPVDLITPLLGNKEYQNEDNDQLLTKWVTACQKARCSVLSTSRPKSEEDSKLALVEALKHSPDIPTDSTSLASQFGLNLTFSHVNTAKIAAYRAIYIRDTNITVATHPSIPGKIICVPTPAGNDILIFELEQSFKVFSEFYSFVKTLIDVS